MTAMDLWSAHDTWSMAGWVFGGACLIVAWLAAERCNLWRRRCTQRDHTIAALQEALEDGRLTMMERRHPAAPVHAWGHRRKARPTRRRGWWPGTLQGDLPVPYGCTEEALQPVRSQGTAPTESDLHRWIRVERLEETVVDMVCTHLENLDAAHHEAPTRQLEAVR